LIGEARPFMASPGRVIVSDIDDTVKPGKDPTTKGDVYPGAAALFAALDAGKDGTDARADIHFVTARDGVVVRAGHTLQETGSMWGRSATATRSRSCWPAWAFEPRRETRLCGFVAEASLWRGGRGHFPAK
jgi:hypothetical protein